MVGGTIRGAGSRIGRWRIGRWMGLNGSEAASERAIDTHEYMDVSLNGGFSPQIIYFNRLFHYKSSILGYPYVWKHPYDGSIFWGPIIVLYKSFGTFGMKHCEQYYCGMIYVYNMHTI